MSARCSTASRLRSIATAVGGVGSLRNSLAALSCGLIRTRCATGGRARAASHATDTRPGCAAAIRSWWRSASSRKHRRCDHRGRRCADRSDAARRSLSTRRRSGRSSRTGRCRAHEGGTRAESVAGTSRTCSPAASQLLCEQVTEAAGGLDGPRTALVEHPDAQREQPVRAGGRASTNRQPGQLDGSLPSSATAVCDPLCGSIPIVTPSQRTSRSSTSGNPRAGTPDCRHSGASLFRATPRKRDPDSWKYRSVASPDTRSGRPFESQPTRTRGR